MPDRTLLALSLTLMLAAPSQAKDAATLCGTERNGVLEAIAMHRHLAAKPDGRATSAPVGRDAGDIAVMYASGGMLSPPNFFDLNAKSVTFLPSGTRYKFATGTSSYDRAADTGVRLDLSDDGTQRAAIPFRFPFFSRTYSELWVNSNGNITFEEGDTTIGPFSIGALTSGPPRIAPLLNDLDPSSGSGVRVLTEASRMVITWAEVPEFGTGNRQAFQVRLFPDGRIEFAYAAAGVSEAVVGIAPGRSRGGVSIVSFLEGSTQEFDSAIAERFLTSQSLDTILLSQRFYQTHDDSYDYLAVYNNMGIPAGRSVVAFEQTVRSRFRRGFGDTPVDAGALYGSASRLQAFLNMGQLSQYPANPFDPVPARGATGDTPLSILAHEAGHLFLALASIRDTADPDARPMLGSGFAHWSFNLNTEASFLGGTRIQDLGENSSPRFRTVGAVEQYSSLDQYLMGLRAPSDVPPTFLVRGSGRSADELPRTGITFGGTRQNITVDQIVAAEGRRSPDHTVAQRHFRIAIILVTAEGSEPSTADLEKLERLRKEFAGYFAAATGGLASMDTALRSNLKLSLSPAAGITAGVSATASVRLDQPTSAPLTVTLRTRNGAARVPASVTIPVGSVEAAFAIQGLREGVEEIAAEPSDARYHPDFARVRVVGGLDSVSLTVTTGDQQRGKPGSPLPGELEVRVSDINLIPFPGISVRAAPSATGVVDPQTAVSGADGIARFRWTPGTGSNQLTFSIPGTPVSTVATAIAIATPAAPGLSFFPIPACRLADTRGGQGTSGSFGPPALAAFLTRDFPVPAGRCGIPGSAKAYSINATVVPLDGALAYLTLWPSGTPRPLVSTLNSFDGGVVSNAAIVPAGSGGAISAFATNNTELILDINGYFAEADGLAFYALDPCRVSDTRTGSGFSQPFGSPRPTANGARDFPLAQSGCLIPANATAHSLNITAVPPGPLAFLTAWATGQPRPFVSTLNSFDGETVANAAIVAGGAAGGISIFVTDASDTIIDTNGYFAAPGGVNPLRFYPVAPCRLFDTRLPGAGPPLAAAERRVFMIAGQCDVPAGAKAFALNVTVAPGAPLAYLTLWPTGAARPQVSTLNSFRGRVVANAAIVPAGLNGSISAFATNSTSVILDISGYFQ